ncbi:GCN5-related N-acetyltransferase [Cordyceps militaris]|uniref:GCN5-related N-acetyltransferase n=1 Tax=Cordyceps militaris TaxID=73501 RepID=A0A2H4SS55_CORMI|nr:GCN5-related N-acetyltransferase [Cordyceps militaris]
MTAPSLPPPISRLSFRRATLADVPAVRALVVSAFRGDASRAGWTTEADLFTDERISEAGLIKKIELRDSQVIVALDAAGRLLGCGEVVGRGVVQIGMLAVAPRSQGHGIGKALLAHLEQVARAEHDAARVEMCVIWTREDVISFYARRGFVRTKRTKPFPWTELVNGKALRDDLYFVVLEKSLGQMS